MRKITKQAGEVVIIDKDDWVEFLSRLKAAIGSSGDEVQSLSGSCRQFCREACRNSGGCDFAFGEPGSCGATCDSGDVFLE